MTTRRPVRARGFTLLEVLIALAIFAIGVLALVPLFATASWGVRSGREVTMATNLARTYVDRIRNTAFGNIGPCPSPCTPPADEVAANAPYVVSWTVTAADGTAYNPAASPNMKRVTVSVTCTACARLNLNIQMITLVSERS